MADPAAGPACSLASAAFCRQPGDPGALALPSLGSLSLPGSGGESALVGMLRAHGRGRAGREVEVEMVPLRKGGCFLLEKQERVQVLAARGVALGKRQVTAFGRVSPEDVYDGLVLCW